jgi:integrase
MGKHDYAILMVLIYGGICRAECAAIRPADFTLKQEHHVLTVQSGKGNKRRDVPLRPVSKQIDSHKE